MKRISRRKFLKCVGSGAAVVALGVLSGCSGASGSGSVSGVYKMGEHVTLDNVDFVMEHADTLETQRPFFETPEDADYVPVVVTFRIENKNGTKEIRVVPSNPAMQDYLNEEGGLEKLYTYCKETGGFAAVSGSEELRCFGCGKDDNCSSALFMPGVGGSLEWFIWAPKGWTTLDLYYSPYFLEGKTLHFSLSTSEVKVN